MVRRLGKFELIGTLGEGTYGKVKEAINSETGEKVAIKIMSKEKIRMMRMSDHIKREITVMKMVKHPNVVGLHEVMHSKDNIFIVLELVRGGELFDILEKKGKLDEDLARTYFQQLVNGLQYCHEQGIAHRDLKPENLLVDSHGTLKISDFGLSFLYTAEELDMGTEYKLQTSCGSPNYVAPEVLEEQGYDGIAADVWSVGVILYVLLAGYLPFDESNMGDLFSKIMRAEYSFPKSFPPDAQDLVSKILIVDAKKRYSMNDIKAHRWFKVGYEEDTAQKLEVDTTRLEKSISFMKSHTHAHAHAQAAGADAKASASPAHAAGATDAAPAGKAASAASESDEELDPADEDDEAAADTAAKSGAAQGGEGGVQPSTSQLSNASSRFGGEDEGTAADASVSASPKKAAGTTAAAPAPQHAHAQAEAQGAPQDEEYDGPPHLNGLSILGLLLTVSYRDPSMPLVPRLVTSQGADDVLMAVSSSLEQLGASVEVFAEQYQARVENDSMTFYVHVSDVCGKYTLIACECEDPADAEFQAFYSQLYSRIRHLAV